MSRGVLIHVHNNRQIDYALIALCNALAIKRHLDVPVCLVADEGALPWLRENHPAKLLDRAFDHVVYGDSNQRIGERRFCDTRSTTHVLPWYNATRSDSYALTPFDETLLIDADYLILDDTLNLVWGSSNEVLINRDIVPLDHSPVPTREAWLEDTGIQLCWATCMYFRKSLLAEMLFDMVRHVRQNYDYYSLILWLPGPIVSQ